MFTDKNDIHIEISDSRISATNLETMQVITLKCTGVKHPRMLIGDFSKVLDSFKKIAVELSTGWLFKRAPTMYIHLQDVVEGGCSELEAKAYREAAYGAGARAVHVYYSQKKFAMN